ncbi:glycoside hydrolase family 3 C-terminal domain-containing protein [Persicobacter psychrovividus]|uniref:Glycosyl hydrolase n=1 Tax=Persicobacter psychrovividus TaxID=387638 RepID=A0ABM7VML8_9BACT|nr:glycosyl hydrolase [Persicobacter psychrovividus]
MRSVYIFLVSLFVCFSAIAQSGETEERPWLNPLLPIDSRVEMLIEQMSLEEKVSQLGNASPAIERLGIPDYNWWNECLHGVARNGRATVFPQAIGMAATFDAELIEKVGQVVGKEARAKYLIAQQMGNHSQYAGLSFWTPNVNIFRDPRWGRGQETYGEDPFLTSKIGVSYVNGLQGNDDQYLQVAACAKHFAVHSGPEELRHEFDAVCSKQDLYETYLPAFKALVMEANVESVMGAYNRVYGEPACGSDFLLQDILRDSWKFKGHVVSDCGAIEDFYAHHKVAKSPEEAAAWALKSGTDLNCGKVYQSALVKAVNDGLVTEGMVDLRLATLYKTRFKLGFFDPVELNPYNNVSEADVATKENDQLAYEVAAASVVLLKNKNNVLPLNPEIKNLYVVGPNATSSEVLLGNYFGLPPRTTNILDGIVADVSAGTTINYKQGVLMDRPNVNPVDWSTGEASAADACIAVMGISSALEGEEGEAIASPTKGDRLDLSLPQHQLDYLKKIKSQGNNPLIVVLTGGSPFVMPELEEIADAIVFAWYPGQAGGRAVGDILFGKVSPSGKLPITFPKSMDQLPDFGDYSMAGRTYRYMDADPLYPFGYGLTYGQFEVGAVELSKNKVSKSETVVCSAKVTNTSKTASDQVIQMYISGYETKFETPNMSLKGFKRVHLNAGESTTVSFELTPEMRSIYDTKGKLTHPKGKLTVSIAEAAPVKRSEELGVNIQTAELRIK